MTQPACTENQSPCSLSCVFKNTPPPKACGTFICPFLHSPLRIPQGMLLVWNASAVFVRGTPSWPNLSVWEGEFKWCHVKAAYSKSGKEHVNVRSREPFYNFITLKSYICVKTSSGHSDHSVSILSWLSYLTNLWGHITLWGNRSTMTTRRQVCHSTRDGQRDHGALWTPSDF